MLNLIRNCLFKCMPLLFLAVACPVMADEKLPTFTLNQFESGAQVSNHDFVGKVLYVDFWASWCIPCRKSFPFMNDLKSQFPAENFHIIAINMDENRQDALAFLEKFPADFDIYLDPGNTLAEALRVPGLPTAYVVDQQGTIRATHMGSELAQNLKPLHKFVIWWNNNEKIVNCGLMPVSFRLRDSQTLGKGASGQS